MEIKNGNSGNGNPWNGNLWDGKFRTEIGISGTGKEREWESQNGNPRGENGPFLGL